MIAQLLRRRPAWEGCIDQTRWPAHAPLGYDEDEDEVWEEDFDDEDEILEDEDEFFDDEDEDLDDDEAFDDEDADDEY